MEIQNKVRVLAALAGTLLAGSPNAQAQPPGGPPPGMMQKIKAWQKWGDQHKKLTLLGDQLFQIEKMDGEAGYGLSKGQAGKMLQILNPWRLKTNMTEDQASGLNKQIGNVLTIKQVKRLTQIEPPSVTMKKRGFGGGRPRPGGGRPGGAPGGGFPQIPDPPKTGWNPLNADSMPFAQARPEMKRRTNAFFASLQHKAHN